MLKRIVIVILFLLTLNSLNAANIELNAYVYQDYTILNYIFTFDNETAQEISFEKPSTATIDYIVDQYGPIKYKIEGNNLVLQPERIDSNTIIVKLRAQELSKEISLTESFRSYQKFNFNIDNFIFKVTLKNDFGEIVNVFPNNNTITNNNRVEWEGGKNANSLYIINFKKDVIIDEEPVDRSLLYIIIIMISFILICTTILIVFYKKFVRSSNLNKKKEKEPISNEEVVDKNLEEKDNLEKDIEDINHQEVIVNKDSEKTVTKSDNLEKNIEDINHQEVIVNKDSEKAEINSKDNDIIKEIIEKHLTENEKSVVQIVRAHEGIQQNEILNYVPSLTKSNLSKIVSKLHAKRILNRIKVGKTNNIYLGDKLIKGEEPQQDNVKE